MKKREEFLISSHESNVENLNCISDDLLKVKWYFLATIASIGIAYYYILKEISLCLRNDAIYITFLIGNIIIFLISEYILSHGFLFRFIQSKIASIEEEYGQKPKNPANVDYFLIASKRKPFMRLNYDYFIPDQFVPIYWATIWAIILNTISGLLLINNINKNNLNDSDIYLFISTALFMITKIWLYHLYKINKFVNENSNIKIYLFSLFSDTKRNFFDFHIKYYLVVSIIILFIFYILSNFVALSNKLAFILIPSLFWFPILYIFFHILKIMWVRLDFISPFFELESNSSNEYIASYKIINNGLLNLKWLLSLIISTV